MNTIRLTLTVLLLFTFCFSAPIANAQTTCCPEGYEGNWAAQFFNNRELQGAPVLTRTDTRIDFAWATGSPHPNVVADNFSVRWQRRLHLNAGLYRFVIFADDGVRLYVDGRLIINNWREMQGQILIENTYLTSGSHDIVLEYFEATGAANVRFMWDYVREGWLGEYWNNTGQSGTQSAVINGPDYVSFTEGADWPPAGVSVDNFSARFAKQQWFEAGRYTFKAQNDGGGFQLWVDGALLINQFNSNGKGLMSATVTLTKGNHDLRVDFYHTSGTARINFWWEPDPLLADWTALYFNNPSFLGGPTGVRSEIAPQFDDGIFSPGFVNHNYFSIRWLKQVYFPAGTYRFMGIVDDGLQVLLDNQHVVERLTASGLNLHQGANVNVSAGNHMIVINFVETVDKAQAKVWWSPVPAVGQAALADETVGNVIRFGSATDWVYQPSGFNGGSYLMQGNTFAEFRPLLIQDGMFEVSAYVPSGATATAVTYVIDHAGRQDRVTINQAANQNAWVSLGAFRFNAGGTEVITVQKADGVVGVDALKVGSGNVSGATTTGAAVAPNVPVSAPTAVAPSSVVGRAHVVQYGDTMFLISLRYGVALSALIAVNPTADPNWIYPGQVLNLP